MSRGNGLDPEHQAEEGGQAKRRAIVSRGLPFVAVYVDAPRHPKIDDLAALVGTAPAALGYLVALWTFAAEFYGDGRIPSRPGVVATFERMARWTGAPGALVAALVEARLLDSSRHLLTVHDWSDYQSAHVERRAREAAVKRRRRAEKRRNWAQQQEVRPGDVPSNVPRQAKPSQTNPNQAETKPASHSDPRSSTAPTDAAGWPEESSQEGKDQDPGLSRFRAELASRLSMPSIGVGKDREHVLAVVGRFIRDWGKDNALAECARIAAESKNGTPANLAWWVGWINTVPRPPEAKP
jgi:hypothetical protein